MNKFVLRTAILAAWAAPGLFQPSSAQCSDPSRCPESLSTTCIQVLDHCTNRPLGGVTFKTNPGGQVLPTQQDSSGCYQILAPIDSNTVLAPAKDDDNPLRNVSTYDMVLISQHIYGIAPLTSPYKLIAADASKSGSITTFDLLLFRKLLLGLITELPNNTTWRFIDAKYVFEDPQNIYDFPEVKSVKDIVAGSGADFYGIKIGDVNCGSAAVGLADRLIMTDQNLRPGEIISVPITLAETRKWYGMQWAFQIDTNRLEVLEVRQGQGLLGSFTSHQPDPGTVRFIGVNGVGETILSGQPLFTLRVRAKTASRLSRDIALSDKVLAPEAYPVTGAPVIPLQLTFQRRPGFVVAPGSNGVATQFAVAVPNPTAAGATVAVELSEATELRLEVFDLTGRCTLRQSVAAARGAQNIEIPAKAMPGAGVYIWRLLDAETPMAHGRLVKSE